MPEHEESEISLYFEDQYGGDLKVDRKHCSEGETRLVVSGHEFYLTEPVRRELGLALSTAACGAADVELKRRAHAEAMILYDAPIPETMQSRYSAGCSLHPDWTAGWSRDQERRTDAVFDHLHPGEES